MTVPVSAFTSLVRAEFQQSLLELGGRIMPAQYDSFVTTMPSTTRVETHSYMSQIPRLREFLGYSAGIRLVSTPWTVENKTYRAGPILVKRDDLDDDQIGGYRQQINFLPKQAQKDIAYKILSVLAAGTSGICFDGSVMFAASHNFGAGNNLMTANNSGNDGLTHKIIAIITDSPIKPMLFQDRESLSDLQTDADTPQASKMREVEYWSDCRFGVAAAAWQAAIHLTITDTPSLPELDQHLTDICDRFRTFTMPKARDTDDLLYVHEGWVPQASNFTLLCNLGLAQRLDRLRTTDLVASGGGGAVVNNHWQDKFTIIPTSALGA